MQELRLIKEVTSKNTKTKVYKGYNCTVKVITLEEEKIYSIEHNDVLFSPSITFIESLEEFSLDFSKIIAATNNIGSIIRNLNDIELFIQEFLQKYKEL